MFTEVRKVQTHAVQVWFRAGDEMEEPEQGRIGVCFRTGGRFTPHIYIDPALQIWIGRF